MRQLNSVEVLALQDGQHVHVKLSRLHDPEPHVEYDGPATLYVQRHNGEIVTITVREPLSWAEADPRHDLIVPDGALVVEDRCMEIFEEGASV
jgi:hypothetical protein